MNLFKIIAKKCKISDNKLKLSAQYAYVLSVLHKSGEVNDIYNNFEKKVLYNIKQSAISGDTELYIILPTYLMQEHRDKLFKKLEENGFTLVYKSYRSIIVNWEQL